MMMMMTYSVRYGHYPAL